jgi:hypothetical protein
MDNTLTKTRNYEYIKSNIHDFNENKIDIIKFNERCMIPNVRWLLGSKDDENIFKFNDLENNPTIIAKLVGSFDDLDALKK